MTQAVVVAATRSPIGRAHKGSLAGARPDELAIQVVRAALAAVPPLDPSCIDDLLMGCAQPMGEAGSNLGRVVAVQLGYDSLPGTTVNRYCSSSLQTTRMAFHAIKAGEGDVFISAGVESVSRLPLRTPQEPDPRSPVFASAIARSARAASRGDTSWHDPRLDGELPDIYIAMGQTAENVARLAGVSRFEMDVFSLRSQWLAEEARIRGFWVAETTPIRLSDGSIVEADDGPRRGVTIEALAELKPAFRPNGLVTAGNCCALNDGAAALVIMSERKAADLGVTPLARIVATAVSGLSPEIMGLGPVDASRKALDQAGLTIDDIDLVEINEAFAAQVIASQRELGIDPERLNVNGGGIAIGHPFGMTGARIATTLIHSLRDRDKQFGLETMCVGGGQGMAMIIERLS